MLTCRTGCSLNLFLLLLIAMCKIKITRRHSKGIWLPWSFLPKLIILKLCNKVCEREREFICREVWKWILEISVTNVVDVSVAAYHLLMSPVTWIGLLQTYHSAELLLLWRRRRPRALLQRNHRAKSSVRCMNTVSASGLSAILTAPTSPHSISKWWCSSLSRTVDIVRFGVVLWYCPYLNTTSLLKTTDYVFCICYYTMQYSVHLLKRRKKTQREYSEMQTLKQ